MVEANADIIVIGAGAAGLMAAARLAAAGKKVCILEARDRLGGRIHTFEDGLEAGAEFVHGRLSHTMGIMQEAGIQPTETGGSFVQVKQGKWAMIYDQVPGTEEWMKTLEQANTDMTIASFLRQHFSDEKYAQLRRMVQGFAEGYDGADIEKAGIMGIKEEWLEEEEPQFRIPGGYGRLIDQLAEKCRHHGALLFTSKTVTGITWKKHTVTVHCAGSATFSAQQVLITVPLGILQTESEAAGSIRFHPAIPAARQALQHIGNGTVIKTILQFRQIFWEDIVRSWRFIFTDQAIPTWWTQEPDKRPILTGWIGGPPAWALENASEESLLHLSIVSLSSIFNKSIGSLQKELVRGWAFNWAADPYSRGSYSYPLIGTSNARSALNRSIEDTLFFAGEALHEGHSQGTVEAAFASGNQAAMSLLA